MSEEGDQIKNIVVLLTSHSHLTVNLLDYQLKPKDYRKYIKLHKPKAYIKEASWGPITPLLINASSITGYTDEKSNESYAVVSGENGCIKIDLSKETFQVISSRPGMKYWIRTTSGAEVFFYKDKGPISVYQGQTRTIGKEALPAVYPNSYPYVLEHDDWVYFISSGLQLIRYHAIKEVKELDAKRILHGAIHDAVLDFAICFESLFTLLADNVVMITDLRTMKPLSKVDVYKKFVSAPGIVQDRLLIIAGEKHVEEFDDAANSKKYFYQFYDHNLNLGSMLLSTRTTAKHVSLREIKKPNIGYALLLSKSCESTLFSFFREYTYLLWDMKPLCTGLTPISSLSCNPNRHNNSILICTTTGLTMIGIRRI